MEINKIYNGDCLAGVKDIEDESVNSIVIDPPYFCGMTNNGQRGEFSNLEVCRPFYVELAKQFMRILKPDGSIYMFCDFRSFPFYWPIMLEYAAARNCIVWHKGSGAGNFYTYEHEFVIFCTPNNKWKCKNARNVITEIKSFQTGAKKTNGEKVHPTQKPIELIEKLILDSTKEGDTVLDCFMGSGTTAVAAKKLNRNFIGFEIQEKYIEIANSRLSEVVAL